MFDVLMTLPWFIHWGFLVFGSAAFSIIMKFVPAHIHPAQFGMCFCSVGALIQLGILSLFLLFGGHLILTQAGIVAAVISGIGFAIVDISIVYMYRKGAPIGLSMALTRIGAALIMAMIGVLFFAEQLDLMKIMGILSCCAALYCLSVKGEKEKIENG